MLGLLATKSKSNATVFSLKNICLVGLSSHLFLIVLAITMHAFQLTLGLLFASCMSTISLIYAGRPPSSSSLKSASARKKLRARRALAATFSLSDLAKPKITLSSYLTMAWSERLGFSGCNRNEVSSLVAYEARTWT